MNTAKRELSPDTASQNQKQASYYPVSNSNLAIQALVQNAAKVIAPVWPLQNFIACNPLQGFEDQHFERVMETQAFDPAHSPLQAGLLAVNRELIKWCSLIWGKAQATIVVPYAEQGFYTTFSKMAAFDKQLHGNIAARRQFLKDLPASAEACIEFCLDYLQVSEYQQLDFLSQSLQYLAGWSGYAKWQTEWQSQVKNTKPENALVEYTAVRLVLTCLLWPDAANIEAPKRPILSKAAIEQLKLAEDLYIDGLLAKIRPSLQASAPSAKRYEAQFIFCIDVRSEPLRRALESLGQYQTLGFAGFFGIPVRVKTLAEEQTQDCCPVLLKPRFQITESPVDNRRSTQQRYRLGQQILKTYRRLYSELLYNIGSPFALVESFGFLAGFSMLLKAVAPSWSKTLKTMLVSAIRPNLSTKADFALSESERAEGISLQEQIQYAETVLRLMGLTKGFAKVVVLVGHGSTTENNPYASALDCGACGANPGAMNAKLLASILNSQSVRRGLEDQGIHIPLDTAFYAGLHNTTTDELAMHIEGVGSLHYPQLVRQLKLDLIKAQSLANAERLVKLAASPSARSVLCRSQDWSETRPEWGLAQNAGFIVAPRWMSQNHSLDGRCFLHSYDWQQDEDGSLLETILTAPMVVAQWINSQYLFSTLDNVNYGSGSKVTQNLVGKMAVMQGNASDLMSGLPLQSVMKTDEEAYHKPQRLVTLVYAPRQRLSDRIAKQSLLKKLFLNAWVHLLVIDPSDQQVYQLNESGTWSTR